MSAPQRNLYTIVYQALKERIEQNEMKDGDKLPSERELAEQFEVSTITTKKALDLLVDEGLVVRRRGLGSFVQLNDTAKRKALSGQSDPMSGGKRIIGLVMEDFSSSFGLELLRSIESAAAKNNYHLCIKRSLGDQNLEEEAIDQLFSIQADGIIIMPSHGKHYSKKILKMIADGFPIVFVDRYLSGIPGAYVGTDNENGAKQLIEHLFAHGHREIGIVSASPEDAVTLKDRMDGYLQAHSEHGLRVPEQQMLCKVRTTQPFNRSESGAEEDIQRVCEFLQQHPDMTAVFAAEYENALIVKKAGERLGRTIPQQLSLVCFDVPNDYLSDINITHIKQDEEKMGELAVELLHQQILLPDTPANQLKIAGMFVQGSSVSTKNEESEHATP